MKILLDTCTFLWWVAGSPNVPPRMAQTLMEPANDVYLSAASTWEIAVKHAAGRLPCPQPPESWIPAMRAQHGIDFLPIGEIESLHIGKLPPLHRDPFDRMLVAQAICHGLELATPDPTIQRYPCRVVWLA